MYVFPNYFTKRNFQSHFLRKLLKPLARKICDLMRRWEISTWGTEHSNYIQRSYLSSLELAMHLAVRTLSKISQGWVFYRTPAENAQSKWFWQRWMQNIHGAVPSAKDDGVLGNTVFTSLLRLRRSLSLCIDNPSYWLQSLYRQYFFPDLTPWIKNLCSATFMFQLLHSPYFKFSINHLCYRS